MEKSQLQNLVFDCIRQRQVTDEPFVHELGDVLGISTDSVYRRLRGETPLNLYEIEKLYDVYDFSLEEVISTSATRLSFNYQPIKEDSFNFVNYLEYINNMMKLIQQSKERRMYYMANDIPFFHLMNSPLIASFKLFFWQKTILGFKSHKGKAFSLEGKDDRINEISRSMRDAYIDIPSVEIYSPQTIGTTLNQIEYYLQAGHFEEPEIAVTLCQALGKLVDHMRLQAEYGKKFSIKDQDTVEDDIDLDDPHDAYKVYYNDILYTDATILVRMDGQKMSYLTNNGLNVLSTKDEHFFNNSLKIFEVLRRKSTHISKGADMDRNRTFNSFKERIEKETAKFRLYTESRAIA